MQLRPSGLLKDFNLWAGGAGLLQLLATEQATQIQGSGTVSIFEADPDGQTQKKQTAHD
jgi:hypothetical protein